MSNIVWHNHQITKEDRLKRTSQKPCVLWFTGLSGSGKSTIANALEEVLYNNDNFTYLLDGDNVRHGLNKDLGFDDKSRIENIRRVGEVAKLFTDSGLIVLTAFISPFESDRMLVKDLLEEDEFIEVFIDTPLEVCESRDPKGLYKKARAGEIKDFTGIDSSYEAPSKATIHIKNDNISVEKACKQIINYLTKNNYITWKGNKLAR
jgi:adenylylsulfate kinase